MAQGEQHQQQGEQQQQPSPVQKMGRALTNIRKVQNMLELSSPSQMEAIKMLRQAGDLVWEEIERLQQQQQQG